MIEFVVMTVSLGGLTILVPRFIYLFIWGLLHLSIHKPILSMISAVVVGFLFDLFHVLPMGQMALFFLCTVGFFELYGTVFHNKNILFVNIYAFVFSILGYVVLEERITVMFLLLYLVVALLMSTLVARRPSNTV
ncbi:hypothetical protein COU89_02200 [Candidatus Roizmanbacteria bacterium CG10_big_fil_rev_8_21_14_0_10_45_7]|uniref:Rod shape-determining protein MreD n=1 Tax=Candidatus Roizmanbacteria bacterium CG10_big_fil_rev_8_21_14_0_10_45_7 TaxID=1974854 RepID=A0A2M8KUP0_9BACT|nr:MAG: hypothetical protein COU89_02200 [Candidatus Roizmanbacteria bacterium CG10_big_fil_rev_8_21_14_0_10_45_7]